MKDMNLQSLPIMTTAGPVNLKMNTSELVKKLSFRFQPPAYAFLTQVRSGTGYSAYNFTRTADAIAMSLWPSRGLELMGFELKVSRTDWIRELKHPDKAEDLVQFCDRWYIVISDKGIIQNGELPPTAVHNVLDQARTAPGGPVSL